MTIVLVSILLICLLIFINSVKIKKLVSIFDSGNVIVSGMRGRGKDMLFCLIVNRRKRDYISNVQYSDPKNKKFHCFPLDLKVWKLAGNSYQDLVSGSPAPYVYPYPDDIDYYISDSGVYFPAQFATELSKRYKSETMFQALSRHLGNANVHCNVQNPNRLWDKIREQSDLYLRMDRCKVFKCLKLVHLVSYSYELYDSFEKGLTVPWFGIGKKAKECKNAFMIQHGQIKKYSVWFNIPFIYDDRRFKHILENGNDWSDEI